MPVKAINILKSFFNRGDKPTESNFADLIDSFVHKSSGVVVSSFTNTNGVVSISFSDNTSLNFNTSQATSQEISFINGLQAALDGKVDKETGKALSSNDFTTELRTKLENLTQVDLPTSYDIAFITGLQFALDSKANLEDVVLSVNGAVPDASGNVTIDISQDGGTYDLTETPVAHNYTYFGQEVLVVAVPLSGGVMDGSDFKVEHNLNIGTYVKLELRNSNGISYGSFLDVDPQSVTVQYETQTDEQKDYLYIEYVSLVEGISVDEIGFDFIGIDGTPDNTPE